MNNKSNFPFPFLGFQIDVARRIERPESLRSAIAQLDGYGYNACMLYVQDTFQYPRHPNIAQKHAYSVPFMQEIQTLCDSQEMELIPMISALGHCQYITSKKGYEKYDEGRGTDKILGTVSPSFPETYTLLRELFEDWCLNVPGKYLHIGLDESPNMGQYAIRTMGKDTVDHVKMFAEHCNKCNNIVKDLGRRMIMWGDMFYYYPEAVDLIDKDIIVVDWYYYSFKNTPKIENFNFAEIDVSGALKKAGIEVWGAPSIWPNLPFPNIEERWQNLEDWVRYGKLKNIDGIMNTDWENSQGFLDTSAFIFRIFAQKLHSDISLKEVLQNELLKMTGIRESECLVSDLLKLGRYHMTGHQDRHVFDQNIIALTGKARQKDFELKYNEVSNFFTGLPDLLKNSQLNQDSVNFLNAITVDKELIELVFLLGCKLPKVYDDLCKSVANSENSIDNILMLEYLQQRVLTFSKKYSNHWNKVRFADDNPPILVWTKNVTKTLKEWINCLKNNSLENHPLYLTPRVECTLQCDRPALPVVEIEMSWKTGQSQINKEIMIPFDSTNAKSINHREQFPCIPIEVNNLPDYITCYVKHYGQIGISGISCTWKGKSYRYTHVSHAGRNVKIIAETVWLGPVAAYPGDPTARDDADHAVWELE